MGDANEIVELFELQGNSDLLTKSELVEYVRSHGCRISDRNLTYYASETLIPPAMRLGQRGVVYPRIAADQLVFVIRCREAGQSIESIRELLPVWRVIRRGVKDQRIDLSEFEYVARNCITRTEANYAVPMLLNDILTSLCADCRSQISWILKDGSTRPGSEEPLTLTFLLASLDEDLKVGHRMAWTQLRLPGIGDPAGDEPTTIVLGIPNGVPLCVKGEHPVAAPTSTPPATNHEEVI